MQCGVYFVHGNTVAKINAIPLGGRPERDEMCCVLMSLFSLALSMSMGSANYSRKGCGNFRCGTPQLKYPQHSLFSSLRGKSFPFCCVSVNKPCCNDMRSLSDGVCCWTLNCPPANGYSSSLYESNRRSITGANPESAQGRCGAAYSGHGEAGFVFISGVADSGMSVSRFVCRIRGGRTGSLEPGCRADLLGRRGCQGLSGASGEYPDVMRFRGGTDRESGLADDPERGVSLFERVSGGRAV